MSGLGFIRSWQIARDSGIKSVSELLMDMVVGSSSEEIGDSIRKNGEPPYHSAGFHFHRPV
jgi:hypothetical protein